MANELYEIGHEVGAEVAKSYEQGLADLSKTSNEVARKRRRQRLIMAVKIWNACNKNGMRGMEAASVLKDVGFTNGEIKKVVQKFLNT